MEDQSQGILWYLKRIMRYKSKEITKILIMDVIKLPFFIILVLSIPILFFPYAIFTSIIDWYESAKNRAAIHSATEEK